MMKLTLKCSMDLVVDEDIELPEGTTETAQFMKALKGISNVNITVTEENGDEWVLEQKELAELLNEKFGIQLEEA